MSDLSFLKKAVRGKVLIDDASRTAHSTDASIFKVIPEAVFVPEDTDDLANAVQAVQEAAKNGTAVSLTARAAGTCMSGGSLTTSIQVDCAKLNRIEYHGDTAIAAQPGAYFRDVEKAYKGSGHFFPSYPASRMLCAIGGMVANNAGGEKNLRYGKTNRYVASLDVILDDGSRATLRKLNEEELAEKLRQENREGEIYRAMHALVTTHATAIADGRPRVTKNSSGYDLWDIWNPHEKTFDLTQVVTGSQGTLCLIADTTLRLEKPRPHSSLTVIFLEEESHIATLVHDLLAFEPESLESFDHHTLSLALRFIPAIARRMGIGMISLGLRFIPEAISSLIHGLPRLTILVELTGDDKTELAARVAKLQAMLQTKKIRFRNAGDGGEANKYWAIRRESFSLLRERTKNRSTAPFMDDLIVRVEDLSEFMPQLEKLMEQYAQYMTYTIAGHVGDGNFHIIPLIDLNDPEARHAMFKLQDEAVGLTLAFGGSTSGEHNDGLIRTKYVEQQFGKQLNQLFEQTKEIWDPEGIFNPGKKVHGDWAFAQAHVK